MRIPTLKRRGNSIGKNCNDGLFAPVALAKPRNYLIRWRDIVNVTTFHNSVTKSGGGAWGTSGCASEQTIHNGFVSFMASNWPAMCALSATNPDANYTSMQFALHYSAGNILIYESGVNKGIVAAATGVEEFKIINRPNAPIQYLINNVVVYTSTITPNADLRIDIGFEQIASFKNIILAEF